MENNTKFVIADDIYGKKSKIPVKNLQYRVSVYGIIKNDNKILISKQWGRFVFPGGGIEAGEDIKKALKRETWEETGLIIRVKNIISASTSFFRPPESVTAFNNTCLFYWCEVVGGTLSVKNMDREEKLHAEMAEWVDFSKPSKIKFHQWIKKSGVLKLIYES
jgi:8-oxo-dGTP pyrophosphatase MutT (NUDIX family)